MRHLTTSLLTLAAASTVVVGLAGTASAAPGDTVDRNRQALQEQVDRRQVETATLSTQIDGSTYLTADHRSALAAEVDATEAGLSAIESQIATADNPTLKTLRDSMLGDFRVFAVLAPKVHETVVDDAELQAVAVFATADPKLAAAIAQAQGNGKDVTAAQASLDDLRSHVATATTTLSGLDATIAGFAPAGYPANQDAIKSVRVSLGAAKADLAAARLDAKQVVEALKA